MCLICLEWEKGKLTTKEALKNIGEYINSEDTNKNHYLELAEKILNKELPYSEYDDTMVSLDDDNFGEQ